MCVPRRRLFADDLRAATLNKGWKMRAQIMYVAATDYLLWGIKEKLFLIIFRLFSLPEGARENEGTLRNISRLCAAIGKGCDKNVFH